MYNKKEKHLKNEQNYGKIGYEEFKTEFEEEKDYPVQIKNNSPWIKDFYKDFKKRQEASGITGEAAKAALEDFERDAGEIYKLDEAKRDTPALVEYITQRYTLPMNEVKPQTTVNNSVDTGVSEVSNSIRTDSPKQTKPEQSRTIGKVNVVYAHTGDVSSCYPSEIENNLKSGDWVLPGSPVTVYNSETFETKQIKAENLKSETETGVWKPASSGAYIVNALTGETTAVNIKEATELVKKDEWYKPLDRVAVYDSSTGDLSECYAYELDKKVSNGKWILPHSRVKVYYAETGDVSECFAHELKTNITSGNWLMENQTKRLYNPVTGESAFYRAQDIKDNMSMYGYVTASAKVKVYNAYNGEEQTVPVTQVAELKSGKNSGGKWYTADEKVTMYDIMGNTHSVTAKDIEANIARNKWSTQPIVGPFKEAEYNKIWKQNLQNTATVMDLMGKTKYKEVTYDGKQYFEALPPDVEIEGLGESTPFFVDMMQEAQKGQISFSDLIDLCVAIAHAANGYCEYKTDNFHFLIKDGYVIVKGAHTESALKRGIKGTRYKISDISPHIDVMKYVKLKPAMKEAFFTVSGRFAIGVDAAVGAGFDIYEAYRNGKRGEKLAVEIVEELGSEAAMAIVTNAASTAATVAFAKILGAAGTAVMPGVGTAVGIIAGMAVGWGINFVYERYAEDTVIEYISNIFDFIGI